MKLNAHDFRKSLEEKKKQKKDAENSLLRMQQDLQASIERRVEYLTNIASLALDAALNGQDEIGLDIDTRTSIEVPFGALDLELIFGKMWFIASGKERAVRGVNVTAFKLNF